MPKLLSIVTAICALIVISACDEGHIEGEIPCASVDGKRVTFEGPGPGAHGCRLSDGTILVTSPPGAQREIPAWSVVQVYWKECDPNVCRH